MLLLSFNHIPISPSSLERSPVNEQRFSDKVLRISRLLQPPLTENIFKNIIFYIIRSFFTKFSFSHSSNPLNVDPFTINMKTSG